MMARDASPSPLANGDLLRAIGASLPDLLYAKDRESRLLYANPIALARIGTEEAKLLGRSDAEWHHDPEQAAAMMAADRRVVESGVAETFLEIFTGADGVARCYESMKAPLRDGGGAIVGIVGVSRDVTAREDALRHRALLVLELNHRVKNTLMAVQGLARHTLRSACDGAVFERFDRRVRALTRAHDLLSEDNWEATCIRRVVAGSLSDPVVAAQQDRVDVSGPPAPLAPKDALALSMALAELLSNAQAHGALSSPDGRVELGWTVLESEVELVWRERGSPAETPEPDRRGFGLRYLTQGAPMELDGEARTTFDAEGFAWELRFRRGAATST
jgi:PAS domain S-box-containing protein